MSPENTPARPARFFKRISKGSFHHGIWAMTRMAGRRGAFFHGDRDEIQASHFTIQELSKWVEKGGGWMAVEEITSEEAIAELADWPEGQQQLREIAKRHEVVG